MSAPSSADERAASVNDRKARHSRLRRVCRRLLLLVLAGLTAGVSIRVRPQVRAWHHRRAARTEVQRYHTSQAIHHLLICREIWPHDPEVLLLSARAARRAGVYGDAERLLKLYRDVRGRDEAHTFEQLLLATEGRVEEYAEQCWKCIEEGRFDEVLLMEALTRGYLRQYRLGQARLCLNRWKEVEPNNPQVYYLEGLLNLDYLHSASSAVESYRHAVELDADHEQARLGLAIALGTDRQFAEAVEQFEFLLQRHPDDARAKVGLAECRDGLGESDEALRLVEEVLARHPRLPAALSLRGQLAFKSGKWAEAEDFLRRALQGNPNDHRARYSLVLCLEQNGQEEEAHQQRSQLSQLEKDTAQFHDLVTKEIAKRPTDPALHCKIGQLLLRAGEREEGVRWLHSALHLDPNYQPARKALADFQIQPKDKIPPSSP
jgi:Flp pilus assembly protein TadD